MSAVLRVAMQVGDVNKFLARGGIIVRLRGLPYECTPTQIISFFRNGEPSCEIMDEEEGILFVRRPDGRSTGDAFVQFAHDDLVNQAMTKHKNLIGPRYIELFTSTPGEVEQVIKKTFMDPPKTVRAAVPQPVTTPSFPLPLLQLSGLPQAAIIPQQLPQMLPQFASSCGTRDCIRLRGLPYEAQVEHILHFLGEYANKIVLHGLHMVYNQQGQPSGEAFIQMDSESSASLAASNCDHRYMMVGGKERYVEVFQCSGDDINEMFNTTQPTLAQNKLFSTGTELAYYPYCDPVLLNQLAVQQQLLAKRSLFSFPPPGYFADPGDGKPKTEQELLSYLMPRVMPPVPTMMPKPSYPFLLAPSLPVNVLGMKRSWDQAFPLDVAGVRPHKRWQSPTVTGQPQTYYHEG